MCRFIVFIALFLIITTLAADEVIRVNQGGSGLWINCYYKLPAMSDSVGMGLSEGESKLNIKNSKLQITSGCINVKEPWYEEVESQIGFVIGNLLDSKIARSQGEFSLAVSELNMVPMKINLKDGGWAVTEEIGRCLSENEGLRVMSGSYWDVDSDSSLEGSHGIIIPSYYWKVIEKKDTVIAWLFPNSQNATRKRSEKYLLSIYELEQKISIEIPVKEWKKKIEPLANWDVSESCIKKPQGPQAAPQG